MGCCGKCTKVTGLLVLILGIIYLVVDLTTWTFFGISWWTSLFVLWGVLSLAKGCCGDCQSCGVKSGAMASKKK